LKSLFLETEFIVDVQKIQQENFKLTMLQDYGGGGSGGSSSNNSVGSGGGVGSLGNNSSSGSRLFRGSAMTMASSFLGHKVSPSSSYSTSTSAAILQQQQQQSSPLGNAFSRYPGQHRIVR
jgi:hypothetical protein